MSGRINRRKLATDIAIALQGKRKEHLALSPRQLLLTGAALLALAPQAADALALGELKVESALGQKFSAIAAARVGPGEVIAADCLQAVANLPGGYGTPVALSADVAPSAVSGTYAIRITSSAALYEPMYEIKLQVSCPGIAAVSRDFVIMLNVPMADGTLTIEDENQRTVAPMQAPTQQVPTNTKPAPVAAETPARSPAEPLAITPKPAQPRPTSARESVSIATPAPTIAADSSYQVQSGDSLYLIATRVTDKAGYTLRQVADAIFAANSDAFINGDPNLLKLGSTIQVPELRTPESTAANVPSPPQRAPAIEVAKPSRPEPAKAQRTVVAEIPESTSSPDIDTRERPASNTAVTQEPPESAQAPVGTVAKSEILATTPEAVSDPQAPESARPDMAPEQPATSAQPETEPAEIAKAAAADVAAESPLPAAEAVQPDVPSESNWLMAIGTGILVGGLLAALIIGRNFLLGLLPARKPRKPAEQPVAAEETIIGEAENPTELASSSAEQEPPYAQPEPVQPKVAELTEEPPQIDTADSDIEPVAAATEDDDAPIEKTAELKISGLTAKLDETIEKTAEIDISELADKLQEQDEEAPRISLHGDSQAEDLDLNLGDFAEPAPESQPNNPSVTSLLDSEESSELDGTSTMHNLFGTGTPDDDSGSPSDNPLGNPADGTAELELTSTMHDIFGEEPDAVSQATNPPAGESESPAENPNFEQVNVDDTSTLQALSETLAEGGIDDDELSRTLTEALDLLEQDYEDELTNSQILEQKDIQKAFAEQAAKDKK